MCVSLVLSNQIHASVKVCAIPIFTGLTNIIEAGVDREHQDSPKSISYCISRVGLTSIQIWNWNKTNLS